MNSTTNRLLLVVLALQMLTLLSGGGVGAGTPASADLPDPAAQRLAMVEEQKKTNAKLDQLIDLMKSGKMKVIVDQNDGR